MQPPARAMVAQQLYWPATAEAAERVGARAGPLSALGGNFGLQLLLEDEESILEGQNDGQSPHLPLEPWLMRLIAGVGFARLSERSAELSADIARAHLYPDWDPCRATAMERLAAISRSGISPNRMFMGYAPRMLLLPILAQGFLSWRRGLSRTLTYELYTRPGLAGADARTAYGVHKAPNCPRATVLGGLAAVGADTICPVSIFPVTHATWDDPEHPEFAARQKICSAHEALEPLDLTPDGSIAGFADFQFGLLQAARRIVERAAERDSKVCQRFDVNPQQMLEWGMPPRVVIGSLRLGASATNGAISEIQTLPGLNAHLLRVGDEHDLEVLAYALDHMTDWEPGLIPQLRGLVILDAANSVSGLELGNLLAGEGRAEIPGLDEIGETALANTGVDIDTKKVHYYRVRRARLTDSAGRTGVDLLVRVRDREFISWSTTQELGRWEVLQSIVTSELHCLSAFDASRMGCMDRFFTVFAPHQAQPTALKTRAYMNVPLLLANLGTVAQLRTEQATRRE